MNKYQEIEINGVSYLIIDTLENLKAEDSFIHNQNKLERFVGSGEARKYVGSYSRKSGEAISHFFDFENWGKSENNERQYTPIQNNCFFSKENLLKYIIESEREYKFQEQIYKNNIYQYYDNRLNIVKSISDDIVRFSIYDVSDLPGGHNRAYIRSDSDIWKTWRKLILPNISYLTINKFIK